MRALCAARVSAVSLGMENESICWLSWPSLVSWTTATLVIFCPSRVTLTCIGPYMVVSTAPVMVRVAVMPPEPAPMVAFAFGEAVEVARAFGFVVGVTGAVGAPVADVAAGEAAGAATSAADEWVLNESSAASPAAVLPRVRMARRMKPPGSKVERLVVDAARRYPRCPQRGHRRLGHAGRPAHVRLVPVQAGDGLLQVLGAEGVVAELVARADQVAQGGLPVGRDRVQLAAEDDVAGVAGPVEEDDAARHPPRQRGEHGPDRGDADPAGDEQHPPAGQRGRERAVGPLGEYPGPRGQVGQRAAVVAVVLDRDPHLIGRRHRRQRVGVRLPPQLAGEEPPPKELPGLGPQPVEVAAGDEDRHDAGRLRPDRLHGELVPGGL